LWEIDSVGPFKGADMLKRYISDRIQEDVKEKMVFISGPRQVGNGLDPGLLGHATRENKETRISVLDFSL
jgi:hypothetical protein